jgi:hypothetical protein
MSGGHDVQLTNGAIEDRAEAEAAEAAAATEVADGKEEGGRKRGKTQTEPTCEVARYNKHTRYHFSDRTGFPN